MPTVFDRLHRLRKLEEQTAQVALAEAHARQVDQQAEITAITEAMTTSHGTAANDASLWATHHRFALDRELSRRGATDRLERAAARVAHCHSQVVQRATEARTVELLAEAAHERAADEARLSERRALDEVGAQRWLRKAS